MYYRSVKTGVSKNTYKNRLGYLLLLESIKKNERGWLKTTPNADRLLSFSIRKNDREMYERAVDVISGSEIPVLFGVFGKERDVRTVVLTLARMNLLFQRMRLWMRFAGIGHRLKRSVVVVFRKRRRKRAAGL